MKLGEIIRKHREENNMTMDSFAQKAGLTKGYISMLEKGKHPKTQKPIDPSLSTIKQISEVLGIELNDLLQMLDDEQPINLKDNLSSQDKYEIKTIAAHHDDYDFTEEELAEIEQFKEFIRMRKRQKEEENKK